MTEEQEDALAAVCVDSRDEAKSRLDGVFRSLEQIAESYRAEAGLPSCREGWPKWARGRASAAEALAEKLTKFLESLDGGPHE
jgi:hypothetical protein